MPFKHSVILSLSKDQLSRTFFLESGGATATGSGS